MKKKFKSFLKKDTKRQNITGKNPRYSWKRHSKGVKYLGDLDPDPVSKKKTKSGKPLVFFETKTFQKILKDKNYKRQAFKFLKSVKKIETAEKFIREIKRNNIKRMNHF